MLEETPYAMYLDDGHCQSGRYWAIGCVSGTAPNLLLLQNELLSAVMKEKREWIEWKYLNGDSKRTRAASNVTLKAIEWASSGKGRIDVLHWDM
jgi:hypothetical protein